MIGQYSIPRSLKQESYLQLLGVGVAADIPDAVVLAKELSRLKKPEW